MSISTKNTTTPPAKIFIDANILVEIIHGRQRFDDAVKFVRRHAGTLAISPLTAHLVMYFGRKIADQTSLEQLLSDYTILPMSQDEVNWAFSHIRDDDFEDALQLACAIHGGCDLFVTLDEQLAQRYRTLPDIKIKLL